MTWSIVFLLLLLFCLFSEAVLASPHVGRELPPGEIAPLRKLLGSSDSCENAYLRRPMKDDVGRVTEWRLSDTRKFITVACALYGGPSEMITVGMNYHVIEGKQTDFEEKFAAVINALRAAEGHSSSTLWKDVSDDASYLITSEWSDEQAFLDFIHSQTFKDVTSWGKEQILSGRPQHRIYKN